MSFPMPIFLPMGFGYGGGMGWKATIFFLGLMGGLLGMLINVMISGIFLRFDFEPMLFVIWFWIGASIGIVLGINLTKDEMMEDFNKRIEKPEYISLATSIVVFGLMNGIIFGMLLFAVPAIENYMLSTLPLPESYYPSEIQAKFNDSMNFANSVMWIVAPVAVNSSLLIFVLFTNWQYNREMKLREKESKIK